MSFPGWVKDFDTKEQLIEELRSHICKFCLEGYDYVVNEYGSLEKEEYEEPVDPNDLYSLLGTSCGCEYMVDDENNAS